MRLPSLYVSIYSLMLLPSLSLNVSLILSCLGTDAVILMIALGWTWLSYGQLAFLTCLFWLLLLWLPLLLLFFAMALYLGGRVELSSLTDVILINMSYRLGLN